MSNSSGWEVLDETVTSNLAVVDENDESAVELHYNRFYDYRIQRLKTEEGVTVTYFGSLVRPCVHFVPVSEDGTLTMVLQPRPNLRQVGDKEVPMVLELPGGFVELEQGLDNDSLEARIRISGRNQIATEAGLYAPVLIKTGAVWPSPGISSEWDHSYFAPDVVPIDGPVDRSLATEKSMRVVQGNFGTLYDEILRSEDPQAAQTIAHLAKAAIYL